MIQTLAIIRGAVLTLAVGLSVSALAESGDPVPDADAGEGNTELEGYFKGKAGSGTLPMDFWLPREMLTPEQQLATPGFCRGAYLWPVFPLPGDAAAGELVRVVEIILADAENIAPRPRQRGLEPDRGELRGSAVGGRSLPATCISIRHWIPSRACSAVSSNGTTVPAASSTRPTPRSP